MPPYVVYKAEHLWDTWVVRGPKGPRYIRSKSGWFEMICFLGRFFTLLLPYCKKLSGPKVLIGDNLSSHISSDVLQACQGNDIRFVCLPPNSTHLHQPLAVAYYRPMKRHWRDILIKWKKTAQPKTGSLQKEVFS